MNIKELIPKKKSYLWVWDIPERIELVEAAGWNRTDYFDYYPFMEPGDWWPAERLRLMVKYE